ncbi:MAG: hypothetical protein PSX36_15630 [bacterium]|nr:hypothetical protein [bacterium]
MKNIFLFACTLLLSNSAFSGNNPKVSNNKRASALKTCPIHFKYGSDAQHFSAPGSHCDWTVIVNTNRVTQANPPGFERPAGSSVAVFMQDMYPDNPLTLGLPVIDDEVTLPDGTTGIIHIPAQSAYYSPDDNGYLFYYNSN